MEDCRIFWKPLAFAANEVMSRGVFDLPEEYEAEYSKVNYLENTIFEHLLLINQLSIIDDCQKINPESFFKDLDIEKTKTMIIGLNYVKYDLAKNPKNKDTFSNEVLKISSLDEEYDDGVRLGVIYSVYAETFRLVRVAAESSGKRLNSKSDEWDGLWHKCGFLGSTVQNRKVCNECNWRKSKTDFEGPHSPFMFLETDLDTQRHVVKVKSIPVEYRYLLDYHGTPELVKLNDIARDVIGQSMLSGIYNRQNRMFPSLTQKN